MKVTILNPEVLENLYKNHGEFACTCYDTPVKYAEKVGKSCCKANGHMSGSRAEYIKFRIEEVDRATAEQIMRHEIGNKYNPHDTYREDTALFSAYIEEVIDVNPTNIVKNMQSFRYVDKNGFTYYTPKNIRMSERALREYEQCMAEIEKSRRIIRDLLVEDGVDYHAAVEDANGVLPRNTHTVLTIAMTPEALIEFMWKRLCTRAQEGIRDVAIQMKAEIEKLNARFASELTPHCKHLLWCPEHEGCGIYPQKEELLQIEAVVSKALQDYIKKKGDANE